MAEALNRIGSLQEYLHLKKLAVDFHVLIGPEPTRSVFRLVDVLPCSLKVLHVLEIGD